MAQDSHGVYGVGATRVSLGTVVRAFERGATAEEIVQRVPSLQLADVDQVVGYYLKNDAEFREYFAARGSGEKALLASHPGWRPRGLRERSMARRRAS